MLATLLNVPEDEASMLVFSFANSDLHLRTNSAIFAGFGVRLQDHILDPISVEAIDDWLYKHQASHNAVNAVLEIAGNDLTTVDFQDVSQLSSWIRLHFSEHQQASLITGVS